MHKPIKSSLRNKIRLKTILKGYFCVERFRRTIRVANNRQEKFTILHVPHIGFLCSYLDSDEILL